MRTREPLRVRNASTGSVVVERLRVADGHWTRLKGLLGTRSLPAGDGLWLRPCRQVHMFGMRYAIDVVFLDDGLNVVGLVSELRPGRVSPKVARATSVLELPAGTIGRLALVEGTRLDIAPVPAA
jgi:uncharacterized membrane protein (UPF0127 family)